MCLSPLCTAAPLGFAPPSTEPAAALGFVAQPTEPGALPFGLCEPQPGPDAFARGYCAQLRAVFVAEFDRCPLTSAAGQSLAEPLLEALVLRVNLASASTVVLLLDELRARTAGSRGCRAEWLDDCCATIGSDVLVEAVLAGLPALRDQLAELVEQSLAYLAELLSAVTLAVGSSALPVPSTAVVEEITVEPGPVEGRPLARLRFDTGQIMVYRPEPAGGAQSSGAAQACDSAQSSGAAQSRDGAPSSAGASQQCPI